MDEKDIQNVVHDVIDRIHGKAIIWRLEGSANLKIQGVDVSVKDLDITTDEEGIKVFRAVLREFIVKDFFSEKIDGTSVVCMIDGFEVEIDSYRDQRLGMFDKIEKIDWKDMRLPVLPLRFARVFYELIDRKEKVELISKYLSS